MLKALKITSLLFAIVGVLFSGSSEGANFPPPGRYQNCAKIDTFILFSNNTGAGTYQKKAFFTFTPSRPQTNPTLIII